MKKIAVLCLAVAAAISARAQFEIELKLPAETFLECENVPAIVTLRNTTAVTIPITGPDAYNLLFDIRGADGNPIPSRENRTPVSQPLGPGASITITNDLLQLYRLPGQTRITVTAVASQRGKHFISAKKHITFQKGSEILRYILPEGQDNLTHILLTLRRAHHEELLLRSDNEARAMTYGAMSLGRILRPPAPQQMTDRAGSSHIVHRSAPEEFTYHIITPDGTVLRRERFTGDYKLVKLLANPDGTVTCNGLPADKSDQPRILQQTPFRPDLHRETKKPRE